MSKLNRSSDSDDSIHFVESSQEVAANIAQSTSPFSLLEDYNQLNSVEPTDETKSPLNIEIQSSSSFVIKLNDSTSKIKSVSTPDEESLDQVDMFLKDYEFLNVSNEYKANENESDTSIIYEKTNDENTLSNVTSAVSSEIIDQQLKQIENITNQSLNKYFDKNVMKIVDDLNSNKFSFEPSMYSSSDENLTLKENNLTKFKHKDDMNRSTDSFNIINESNEEKQIMNTSSQSYDQKKSDSLLRSNEFYAQINELDQMETAFESTESICKYILPASSRIDSPKRLTNSITSSIITSSIDPGSPILTNSGLSFPGRILSENNLGDSMYSSNFSTSSSKNNEDLNEQSSQLITSYELESKIKSESVDESPVKSNLIRNIEKTESVHEISNRKTKQVKILSRELKQDKILAKENKIIKTRENNVLDNENEMTCKKEIRERDCVKIIKNLDELKKSIEDETDNIEQDLLELINFEGKNLLIQNDSNTIIINEKESNDLTNSNTDDLKNLNLSDDLKTPTEENKKQIRNDESVSLFNETKNIQDDFDKLEIRVDYSIENQDSLEKIDLDNENGIDQSRGKNINNEENIKIENKVIEINTENDIIDRFDTIVNSLIIKKISTKENEMKFTNEVIIKFSKIADSFITQNLNQNKNEENYNFEEKDNAELEEKIKEDSDKKENELNKIEIESKFNELIKSVLESEEIKYTNKSENTKILEKSKSVPEFSEILIEKQESGNSKEYVTNSEFNEKKKKRKRKKKAKSEVEKTSSTPDTNKSFESGIQKKIKSEKITESELQEKKRKRRKKISELKDQELSTPEKDFDIKNELETLKNVENNYKTEAVEEIKKKKKKKKKER